MGRLQLLIYLCVHGVFFFLSVQLVGCCCSFTCVSIGSFFFLSVQWVGCCCSFICVSLGCFSSSQCHRLTAVAHLPVCPWDVFLPLISVGKLQLFIYLCVHEMCFFISMQWVGCSYSFTCVSMGCFSSSQYNGFVGLFNFCFTALRHILGHFGHCQLT